MYRLKIELKNGEVYYYKLLKYSDVLQKIADNSEAMKINVWLLVPKVKEK